MDELNRKLLVVLGLSQESADIVMERIEEIERENMVIKNAKSVLHEADGLLGLIGHRSLLIYTLTGREELTNDCKRVSIELRKLCEAL